MDLYCDHNRDSDYDDDKLLLDDENTNRSESCFKCRSKSLPNTCLIKPILSTTTHSSVTVVNELNERIGSSSYRNGQCNNLEHDFHCHNDVLLPEDHKAWKKLVSVSLLCFFFMVAELIGGYLAGSLAVMTDAAHLFSDLIGFFVSLISIWIGKKSPTRTMTFGYHRAEVLGAFLSVLAVWLLAGIFCVVAVGRLLKKEYEIDANTMLVVASIGVVVNILMGAVLHGLCHTHSHGGPSHHNVNINVRAAAAHVIGDLLQSIGVLLAAIIIKIFPKAQVADPICTLLFSIIVVYATLKVAHDAIKILLEASPKHAIDFNTMFIKIQGVKHVHGIHIWSLAPGKDAVTVHLAVDQSCDRDLVLKQATGIIRSQMNVVSSTIQIEKYNEELIRVCSQCQILS
ncbi:hypothetical protein RN001_000425 [Aquatica leii]|uniref:Zinc transporter 2-like n=1 Tax=Aquatica leii TaxID=1421715 RepID=A0AAN7PEW9_9COLE|nr:hypothetical protein RN001_000425 [Aquatica leii]